MQEHEDIGRTGPAVVRPGALPTEVVEKWLAVLADAERAQFWNQYHWAPLGGEALEEDTLLGQTVSLSRTALSSSEFDEGWAAVRGVEVWAQCRSAGSGIHMHWDVDEGLGRRCGQTATPWKSIVVYLSSDGGPTLVCEQRPADAWVGRMLEHLLVWPTAGTLLAMQGDRLHGVLSNPEQPTAGEPVRAGARVTSVIPIMDAAH